MIRVKHKKTGMFGFIKQDLSNSQVALTMQYRIKWDDGTESTEKMRDLELNN